MLDLLRPSTYILLSTGLLATFSSSCARLAPVVDLEGSFVPAWMLCAVVAIAACLVLRALIIHAKLQNRLEPIALFYSGFTLTLACILWLLFFR